MLDLELVENTIKELENSDTTYNNCEKLASLYIIKDYHSKDTVQDEVTKELSDILPHYDIYCDKKREYQVNKVGEDVVLNALNIVCKEISEFMSVLYSSTDMPEERDKLVLLITDLQNIIK